MSDSTIQDVASRRFIALHLIAGVLATLTIATFLVSTLAVELFGSPASIAYVKGLIVLPGLLILVPAIAATGGTGFGLSKLRQGRLVDAKKKRMPVIAANGLIVLVPCAIVLHLWAAQGLFDARFYLVQALELFAGVTNLTLMALNIRDGLRLGGRLHPRRAAERAAWNASSPAARRRPHRIPRDARQHSPIEVGR